MALAGGSRCIACDSHLGFVKPLRANSSSEGRIHPGGLSGQLRSSCSLETVAGAPICQLKRQPELYQNRSGICRLFSQPSILG
jgi:hypothetical protein